MATLTQRPFVEIMKKIHSTARPTQDGNKNYFVDKENSKLKIMSAIIHAFQK